MGARTCTIVVSVSLMLVAVFVMFKMSQTGATVRRLYANAKAEQSPIGPSNVVPIQNSRAPNTAFLRGSFMRIAGIKVEDEAGSNVTGDVVLCEPYPSVDSVALQCTRNSPTQRVARVVVWLQFQLSFRIAQVSCGGCADGSSGAVSQESPDGRSAQLALPVALVSPKRELLLTLDVAVFITDELRGASTCFLTIGDWGSPARPMLRIAESMARVAREKFVKFAVSTGDNFYPTGVRSVNDPQFRTTFETPFSNASLRYIRWLICAGNHDQWGLQPQIQYTLTHPRWYFPEKVYVDRIPVGFNSTANFVVLDTFGRDRDAQLRFLGSQLSRAARTPSNWRFVLNHGFLFSGSLHARDGVALRPFVKPIVDANGVDAYFSGHDHALQVLRSGNTDYFVSGGGGGSASYDCCEILPETVFAARGRVFGFMSHCASDTEMLTTVYDDVGRILFERKTVKNPPFPNQS